MAEVRAAAPTVTKQIIDRPRPRRRLVDNSTASLACPIRTDYSLCAEWDALPTCVNPSQSPTQDPTQFPTAPTKGVFTIIPAIAAASIDYALIASIECTVLTLRVSFARSSFLIAHTAAPTTKVPTKVPTAWPSSTPTAGGPILIPTPPTAPSRGVFTIITAASIDYALIASPVLNTVLTLARSSFLIARPLQLPQPRLRPGRLRILRRLPWHRRSFLQKRRRKRRRKVCTSS